MSDKTENINNILSLFKIQATCQHITESPNATYYDLALAPGFRIRAIEKYLAELTLALRLSYLPTIKILNDQGILRLECIKNNAHQKVNLFDLGYKSIRPAGKLTCLLGETIQGEPLWFDVSESPHILIAGATGSGKSTLLHTLIANFLLYPKVSLSLMDPKNVEFYSYGEMEHKRITVSFDYEECLDKIEALSIEMEERYRSIREFKMDRSDIPYIVLIIDEFADLISQDRTGRFYAALCRLSQKSRAANIHIILSTQRPSIDVVSGTIKANFPTRIACKVSSGVDSRVILDTVGAQNLLGRGDALLKTNEPELHRFQVAYTSADEIKRYFK